MESEYMAGENGRHLDGAIVQIMDVFEPDDENNQWGFFTTMIVFMHMPSFLFSILFN